MEKVKFQYTPIPDDYAKSIKIYSTNKQKRTSIGNGLVVFILFIMVANLFFNNDDQLYIYSLPILFTLILIPFLPTLSAWQMKRKASKQPLLLQPITYEIDNEQILSTTQLTESKIDWSVFHKAIETNEYYFLIYTVNKNMFQFIPKRAFVSPEQETNFRNLVEQKLGKIENIQKGLRGWKLSLLTFGFFMFFSMGCLFFAIILDSL